MRWIEKTLRGKTIYARVKPSGELATDSGGRVEIIYKRTPGAKIYRAAARNLEAGESTEVISFEPGPPAGKSSKAAAKPPAATPDTVIIYTDGACSGNPGPMGIGAVIVDGEERQEISEFLGVGTNNIAELTAILRALESLNGAAKARPVHVHTDSSYAIGLLTKGWKAKANQELVATLRELAGQFPKLALIKVKGHAGIPENERADRLAVMGAQQAR